MLSRIPVVSGLAFIEAVRRQPSAFTVTLAVEERNPWFPQAIAVRAGDAKLGYVAPELARRYFEPIRTSATPVSCPARRASVADQETSGVEVILDFSGLTVNPSE